MLKIKNLHVETDDKEILHGIDLEIKPGEVHAIMGPNGSGKSTLANILVGSENFAVTKGSVEFAGKDILTMPPEERATLGIFLAFQYPIEIPGINNMYFLKAALNSMRKKRGEKELDAFDFTGLVREKMHFLEMDESFLQREVNVGFSGGEKKRNEILQMMLLEPKLSILDETDSGLDIDALQIISKGVNSLRNSERSFIVITHYQRLLNYIEPDFVHILYKGKIAQSGDKRLALELETKGYGWLE